jgi:hypothetical protein
MYELPDSDPLLQGFGKSAIDTISKIDRDLANLTKRLDEMDAKIVDIKSGNMFADFEKMAAGNRETSHFWQRHSDRLSK